MWSSTTISNILRSVEHGKYHGLVFVVQVYRALNLNKLRVAFTLDSKNTRYIVLSHSAFPVERKLPTELNIKNKRMNRLHGSGGKLHLNAICAARFFHLQIIYVFQDVITVICVVGVQN